MRANAMARVDDSIGTRAPILDSDCKIQSNTPIAPNRAYPFGPVLSMPETPRPGLSSARRTYINSLFLGFLDLQVRRLRCGCRQTCVESAHRPQNDGSAHLIRRDSHVECQCVDLRRDD